MTHARLKLAPRKKVKKTFVLDTNVILHDCTCIGQFDEHDVVIPVTVIEELDNFKKGNDTINHNARQFARTLDGLCDNAIFNGGVPIGPHQGRITVRLEQPFHPDIARSFSEAKADHHILNTAYCLSLEKTDRQVILVTKDVNLRMKAKSAGLTAQDYSSDRVTDLSSIYRGMRLIENVDEDVIDSLFDEPVGIQSHSSDWWDSLRANENLILRNQNKSVLARYNAAEQMLVRIDRTDAYGIEPRNAEQTFALAALLDNSIRLVSVTGKAGTGKTLLAMAAALENRRDFNQIYLARPIVALSNKDIGYLPGSISEKLDPYMQPLFDNLGVIRNQFSENDKNYKKIGEMLDLEKLKIAPLAYIRGRSLVNIYFIVDEAQNLTPNEVKTIVTRAGEGTKVVFCGDINQIDHPYLDSHSNGLSYLVEKMTGQNIYAHVNLEKGERSELAEIAANLL